MVNMTRINENFKMSVHNERLSICFVILLYIFKVTLSSLVYSWQISALSDLSQLRKNKLLDVSAMYSYNDSSTFILTNCLMRCHNMMGCRSINFLRNKRCDLLNTTRTKNSVLVDATGYVHVGLDDMTLKMVCIKCFMSEKKYIIFFFLCIMEVRIQQISFKVKILKCKHNFIVCFITTYIYDVQNM